METRKMMLRLKVCIMLSMGVLGLYSSQAMENETFMDVESSNINPGVTNVQANPTIPNLGFRNIIQHLPQHTGNITFTNPASQNEGAIVKKRKATRPQIQYVCSNEQNTHMICTLPEDVWHCIFSLDDEKTLNSFSMVCNFTYATADQYYRSLNNQRKYSAWIVDREGSISSKLLYFSNERFVKLLLLHRNITMNPEKYIRYDSVDKHYKEIFCKICNNIINTELSIKKNSVLVLCASLLDSHKSLDFNITDRNTNINKDFKKKHLDLLESIILETNNDPNMKIAFNYILSINIPKHDRQISRFKPFVLNYDAEEYKNSSYVSLLKDQDELTNLRNLDHLSADQCKRIIEIDKYPGVNDFLNAAMAYQQSRQFKEALELLKKFVQTNKDGYKRAALKEAATVHGNNGDVEGFYWCWEQWFEEERESSVFPNLESVIASCRLANNAKIAP